MNKQQKEEMKDLITQTNMAMSFITKGKVWLEINEKKETLKQCGEKIDLDNWEELIKNRVKPDIAKVFKHFGWKYIKNKKEKSLTGEGVIAYMFFSIMMGSIKDSKTINKFFKNLHLTIKEH